MQSVNYRENIGNSVDKSNRLGWLIMAGVAGSLLIGSALTYNGLVARSQAVDDQWAQVENVYQRRLDLVPNLVETVKGAAAFEKSTFEGVTKARSEAQAALTSSGLTPTSSQVGNVQQTQDRVSDALARLMVVVENYPKLGATENFRDLQAQLEGTENRITVERMRFNEAALAFNASRDSFPTNLVANLFGSRFRERSYFQADQAAATAPKVKF